MKFVFCAALSLAFIDDQLNLSSESERQDCLQFSVLRKKFYWNINIVADERGKSQVISRYQKST